ncbi:hypothetical protein SDC9_187534 [bioreactor metagenome]|uniref:Uncharacterized protein n=1 Tax=bioreactor metagenome TaxID=1076179 RepID=A0A645HP35_9ZZZZ
MFLAEFNPRFFSYRYSLKFFRKPCTNQTFLIIKAPFVISKRCCVSNFTDFLVVLCKIQKVVGNARRILRTPHLIAPHNVSIKRISLMRFCQLGSAVDSGGSADVVLYKCCGIGRNEFSFLSAQPKSVVIFHPQCFFYSSFRKRSILPV